MRRGEAGASLYWPGRNVLFDEDSHCFRRAGGLRLLLRPMPTLGADEILQSLRAGRYEPVYFLQGEEPFDIDRVSNYIEAHAIAEHERGFNQVVLYGRDTDVATVLSQARRYPMMAERSVVIVREAQALPDLERDPGQALLLRYLEKPTPSTVLVFCHKHKTLDGRKPLGKAATKHATVLTSKKLYDNQVLPWLTAYVKSLGAALTPGAVQLLVQRAGIDLSRLAAEVEKVLAGRPPGDPKPVDEAAVLAQVGLSREYTIFELQTALVQGNAAKVEQIVRFFEANPKDNPVIPMLALLFSYFARLLVYQQLAASGSLNLKEALGKRAFVPGILREYEVALERFPPARARRVIAALRRADMQAKGIEGGTITDADILRDLTLTILRG